MSLTIVIDNDAVLTNAVARLAEHWKNNRRRGLLLTIEHAGEPRTQRQLRRYWKLLRQIAEHAVVDGRRYSAEHWDEWYRGQLIGVDELDGERVALSASDLTVGEMNDYMRAVEHHAVGELRIELDMQ